MICHLLKRLVVSLSLSVLMMAGPISLRLNAQTPSPVPTPDSIKVGDQTITNWTRTGGLGHTPKHTHNDLPLSDQSNHDHWTLDKDFSDEFDGSMLDAKRWHILPAAPDDWKGREPALFLPSNVTVSDGTLHLAFRKGDVPEMQGLTGYSGYTSCAICTNARSGYGYYEAMARAGNSAASSAFWLTDTGLEQNATEIDIFEVGAKSPDFAHKYNMTLHIWRTPQSTVHRGIGTVWTAPYDFAGGYHVYGFEWNKDYMEWYVDGVPVRTAINTDWYYPMQIYFDSEAMFDWFGKVNDADLPVSYDVKYLRVWRHHPGGQ